MGYTAYEAVRKLNKQRFGIDAPVAPQPLGEGSLEKQAVHFIRERCEGLRFDLSTEERRSMADSDGRSLNAGQVPFNMEKDTDRLCFENAVHRFFETGAAEDAFDVYFCFLEMFAGDSRLVKKMTEPETDSGWISCYSRSVYVFLVGIAVYDACIAFREAYSTFCGRAADEKQAAHHFLKYWGITALFRDAGYPSDLLRSCCASPYPDELFSAGAEDEPAMDARPLAYMLRLCDELLCGEPASCGPNMMDSALLDDIKLVSSGAGRRKKHSSDSSFSNLYDFAVYAVGRSEDMVFGDCDKEKEYMEDQFCALSLEYKMIHVSRVKKLAEFLDKIHCMYTDRPVDMRMVTALSEDELKVIGPLEHTRWLWDHYIMGWIYDRKYDSISEDRAEVQRVRELTRTHKLMMEDGDYSAEGMSAHYYRLPVEEQIKDYDYIAPLIDTLSRYDGIRIYRLD